MTPAARPLDAFAIAIVLVLCITWGFNQVAIKFAVTEIPPLVQAAARSAGAAVIIASWARLRGVALTGRDGTLAAGVAAGVLFAAEFTMIYRGLTLTTASRGVLFLYTAPFVVVVGARWLLPGDRFSVSQWLGLALSFLGIVVAFGLPDPAFDARVFTGDMMLLVGGALWGATTLLIKASKLARISQEKALLYQLVVSAPLLGLAALAFGESIGHVPSNLALGSLTFQTVWVVGFTFLAWFMLIQRYSASRVSAFTFLTPLFGVAFGHLVLDEPLTPTFLAAATWVAAGLVLVNRPR